jgi:hypothetical protein
MRLKSSGNVHGHWRSVGPRTAVEPATTFSGRVMGSVISGARIWAKAIVCIEPTAVGGSGLDADAEVRHERRGAALSGLVPGRRDPVDACFADLAAQRRTSAAVPGPSG